jgi:hypothetical protein
VRETKSEELVEGVARLSVTAKIVHLVAGTFFEDEHGDRTEDQFINGVLALGSRIEDFKEELVEIGEELANRLGKQFCQSDGFVLVGEITFSVTTLDNEFPAASPSYRITLFLDG